MTTSHKHRQPGPRSGADRAFLLISVRCANMRTVQGFPSKTILSLIPVFVPSPVTYPIGDVEIGDNVELFG